MDKNNQEYGWYVLHEIINIAGEGRCNKAEKCNDSKNSERLDNLFCDFREFTAEPYAQDKRNAQEDKNGLEHLPGIDFQLHEKGRGFEVKLTPKSKVQRSKNERPHGGKSC